MDNPNSSEKFALGQTPGSSRVQQEMHAQPQGGSAFDDPREASRPGESVGVVDEAVADYSDLLPEECVSCGVPVEMLQYLCRDCQDIADEVEDAEEESPSSDVQ